MVLSHRAPCLAHRPRAGSGAQLRRRERQNAPWATKDGTATAVAAPVRCGLP